MKPAKYDIEIYERPIGFLDDHFRSGWNLVKSAASQSFVNNGGVAADLGLMQVTESDTSDGAEWEKSGLSVSTDTYKKFIARLRGLGYNPMYYITVIFTDASNVNTGWQNAPSDMTLVSLDLPSGKTVEKIKLSIRAGNGANNESAEIKWDYVIIVKDSPITPTEVKEIDVELAATTSISGFKFVLINDKGLYTEKPEVGDFVMIHLAAGEEGLDQKLISGYITDKQPSGDPGNPVVTITGSDLGQLFHDRTFTKKYTAATLVTQVMKDIQTEALPELTHHVDYDSDNSITPEFNEEGVFNLLKKLAESARKDTVYGYDFYVDPAGVLRIAKNPFFTCLEKIYAGMFYDDFRGNLDKWPYKDYSASGYEWSIQNEELDIDPSGTENAQIRAGNDAWTNYVLKFRLKLVAVGGDNRCLGACYFRDTGATVKYNCYYLVIGYNDAYTHFRLMKFVNGGWNDIQDVVISTALGTWYDIKVEVNGNSIKCYFNGEKKIDLTDDSHSAGKIGLQAEAGGHVRFDDVSVKVFPTEPAYNIKRLTWKETIEDIGNEIKLLIREGEYEPHSKDAWTEEVTNWEAIDASVYEIVQDADVKVGSYSIKASFSGATQHARIKRSLPTVDKTKFKRLKFWFRWSATGTPVYLHVRLTNEAGYINVWRKTIVLPTEDVWSFQNIDLSTLVVDAGNPTDDIVSIQFDLEDPNLGNVGDGAIKIDGLHFAYGPVYKTASDSASQNKYGKKKRDFEDFTITDENFAQYMANALCQALKNPIKHVHVVVPGKAQEGYRPPAQIIVSSAKDNIHYEYFKILKARHHYVTSREDAPLYICDLDLIAAKKTDGTYEVPIAKEPPSIRALKPITQISPSLKAISRKGYYWY